MKPVLRTSLELALLVVLVGLAQPARGSFQWGIPDWIPPPAEPADNPTTPAKVALGRHLFYDKRLSANQSMSCATCHEQERAFTDGKRTAVGITHEPGKRNTMSLGNAAYFPTLTWGNPQVKSLEAQARIPILGDRPVELGMTGRERLLLDRLEAEPRYRQLFADAFPEARASKTDLYSLSTVTKALASFQRTLLSFDSAYDRYRYGGDKKALSPAAQRGEALFRSSRMKCYRCHGSIYFTDNVAHARMELAEMGFHNTGLYNENGKGAYPAGQEGVAEVTGKNDDTGRFRTPSLRNVALTSPYMHDGSIARLQDGIRTHSARKGRALHAGKPANPLRSSLIAGFEISERETADLVEFLKSLTDESFVKNPNYSDPWSK